MNKTRFYIIHIFLAIMWLLTFINLAFLQIHIWIYVYINTPLFSSSYLMIFIIGSSIFAYIVCKNMVDYFGYNYFGEYYEIIYKKKKDTKRYNKK